MRLLSSLLLTLFSITTVLSAPIAPIATSPRALWLWTSELIKDPAATSTFLSDVKNHGITTVHALIDRDMGVPVWSDFITKCTAAGLSVEALMGDPQWIVGKTTSPDCPTFDHQLDWITKYQAAVPKTAQLKGIHLDVEPWIVKDWASNQKKYVDSLVTIYKTAASTAKSLNISIAADLPFWATTIPCQDTTLDVCALKILDSATFMTYRNSPAALLDIAGPLLKNAKTHNPEKKVWLSVETLGAVEDVMTISYAAKGLLGGLAKGLASVEKGLGLKTMLNDLVTVDQGAKKYEQFAGIAIHDYKNMMDLANQ